MYGKDLIVLILLWLGIFQGCRSEDCPAYDNSGIKCDDLSVDNGDVCYTRVKLRGEWRWQAKITCNAQFYRDGSSTRTCRQDWYWDWDWYWYWYWDGDTTKCIPDPTLTTISKPSVSPTSPFEATNTTPTITTPSTAAAAPTTRTTTTMTKTTTTTTRTSVISILSSAAPTAQEIIDAETTISEEHGSDSLLAVYIAVPLLVLVMVVVGLLLWFVYRRRNTSAGGSKRNLTETNKTYGVPVDREEGKPSASVENSNSEYAEIPECVNQTTNGNYNTMHTNNQCAASPNYNHAHAHSDTYDHTTSIGLNAEGESQTYSHLNDSKHKKPNPRQNKMDIDGVDSDNYNHIPVQSDTYDNTTNIGRNSNGESETYSHLNDRKHNDRIPDKYKTGNIYNEPHVGDDWFKNSSEDPHYDHTDTHSDAQAGIELDTYAHVNAGLDDDDAEYSNNQESHTYFVLEKVK